MNSAAESSAAESSATAIKSTSTQLFRWSAAASENPTRDAQISKHPCVLLGSVQPPPRPPPHPAPLHRRPLHLGCPHGWSTKSSCADGTSFIRLPGRRMINVRVVELGRLRRTRTGGQINQIHGTSVCYHSQDLR
jgi:hypothetical protein